jgi:hypothetical protein
MSWDFWRIDWPNVAAIFALAVLPVITVITHTASDKRETSMQVTAESLPVSPALVTTFDNADGNENAACRGGKRRRFFAVIRPR